MEILSSMLDSFKECPNIDEVMTIVFNEEVNGEDQVQLLWYKSQSADKLLESIKHFYRQLQLHLSKLFALQ